jgi:hypothetical protein
VAYHEYGDPFGAITYVDDLRAYLKARGLARPISVNEIPGQESWTNAGYTAGVIAAYERADIMSAMRSCWPGPNAAISGLFQGCGRFASDATYILVKEDDQWKIQSFQWNPPRPYR